MDTICICKPNSSSHNGVGIFRSTRKLPPADYLFKIESYSLFTSKKYVSSVFQSGGYKWNLVLHPGDNSKSKDKGHVSLMLRITDTEKFSHGWKINVNFKMFVYDQLVTTRVPMKNDAGGAVRTFSEKNTELGFEELISSKDLLSSSNGYVVNDSCEFGVEVFVIGHSAKSEILSMVKNPTLDSFHWKLGSFSTLQNTSYQSDTKLVGERDWILSVYPKGDGFESRDHLSVYLELKNCAANRTVYADYTLKLVDQISNTTYHVKKGSSWFRPSSAPACSQWKALVSNWFGSHAMGFAEFNKGNGFVRKKCFNHGG